MISKRTILIVDDDADDREILRDAFSSTTANNQEYILLENGDKLIEYLQGHIAAPPSLILLDLNMPGKDGREALKEIKSDENLKTIPIVIFTTSSSHRDRDISYELGANCFVTKPDAFPKMVDLANSISRLWLS